MCGRYTLRASSDEIQEIFGAIEGLDQLDDWTPRYNVAPTQDVPVIYRDGDDPARFGLFRWGLIPSWADDPSIGNRMINARAESVTEKPSYRTAFRKRRCLVLADGYYEWQKLGKQKQPHLVEIARGGPFAMAGLWEIWGKPEPLRSCTIITTAASPQASAVHDRMPLILSPLDAQRWLDPAFPADEAARLLEPYTDDLRLRKVPTVVNNPRNEDPRCVEAFDAE